MTEPEWTAAEMARITGGKLVSGRSDLPIRGISNDTRTLKTGDLYIALRGDRFNGHAFIEDAAAKGAAAVLVDEFFIAAEKGRVVSDDETTSEKITASGNPGPALIVCADTLRALGAVAADWRSRFSARLAAITGSNGKTTTRAMIGAVLSRSGSVLETEGNLNNEIGLPRTLLGLRDHHQWAAVELGMNQAGEIRRLTRICRPDIAVVTNIGPAHIGELGSMDAIVAAKGELLAETPAGCAAVLNRDDPWFADLADQARSAGLQVTSVGLSADADIRATDISADPEGLGFRIHWDDREMPVRIGFSAPFMAVNALLAAAVGRIAGMEMETIVQGLSEASPVGGRMRIRDTARGIRLVDDTYNANPASVAAALSSLGSMMDGKHSGGRIFAALGDMLELGDHAPKLHRRSGRNAVESGVYWLAAFGDHAEDVLAGAREGGMPSERLILLSNYEDGVDRLKRELQTGDLLLVKGSRGLKMENLFLPVAEWADEPA